MAETTMSRDGTTIAYERRGRGEPLILAGLDDSELADLLSPFFTVISIGRVGSVAELSAVIEVAGGEADVVGHASSALIAVQAVVEGLPIARLALIDPLVETDDFARIAIPTIVIATPDCDPHVLDAAALISKVRVHVLDEVPLADVLEEFFG